MLHHAPFQDQRGGFEATRWTWSVLVEHGGGGAGSDVMSERLTPRYHIGLYQVTFIIEVQFL